MPAYTTDTGDNSGRRQVVATVVFVLLSIALSYLPNAQQQQIASALRATVLSPFIVAQGGITEARSRATDSEELRRQMDSLVATLSGQRSLAEENRRLRGLLEIRTQMGNGWVPSSVVRPRTSGSESMFLLDVGSEDGVELYAPVLTRQGLVGRVVEVRKRSAIGMDWTHPDFRASAMDAAGLSYGIVESRRGEFREEDRLEFNGTAFSTRLEDGTVVVTSGLGGVFPRGIPIGKVEGLAEADAGWRKSYWLRPMVEPGSVTHVLVGTRETTQGDLSPLWPADSVLTETELVWLNQQREDSLRALGDSVRLLRAIVSAPRPVRDSVLATLLFGGSVVLPADTAGVGGRAGAQGARQPGRATAPDQRVVPPSRDRLPLPTPERRPEPLAPLARPATGGDTARRFPRPADTVQVGGARERAAPPDTGRARDTLRPRRDTLRQGALDPAGDPRRPAPFLARRAAGTAVEGRRPGAPRFSRRREGGTLGR